ncbi:uncharacterized protein LOC123613546 isoform X2 [Camelus bactrianus]|uniref:Uncharacterized protein LOC123613546 isoform X2 n=1 Tax=Camelus bactrianus TaxID=9837 RepID=A0AC58PGS1_CAMBA
MEKGVTEANISRTSPALIREGVIPGCTGVCGFNSPWADKNQISDCKAKPTLLLEGVSTNRVLLGGCRKHLIPSFADWGYSPLEVNHLPAQLAQDGRRKCVLEELTLGPQEGAWPWGQPPTQLRPHSLPVSYPAHDSRHPHRRRWLENSFAWTPGHCLVLGSEKSCASCMWVQPTPEKQLLSENKGTGKRLVKDVPWALTTARRFAWH